MLRIKRTGTPGLLVVVGLVILSFILAACESGSISAETPSDLQTEASDTVVETVIGSVSEVALSSAVDNVVAPAGFGAGAQLQSGAAGANGNGNSNQARIQDGSQHDFDPDTAAELSVAEEGGLLYMREEEKLARDVYLALYDQWGLPVFQNIAGSEQAHMDSILMLLEQYDLADPAAGKGAGEFSDPLFQTLYAQLVEQGSASQSEALKVGATIEELDIVDLQERISQTDNATILQVYGNLLAGSENHLRAFVTNLERQTGEEYQPVYLDQDAYEAIISGASGQRGGYGGGNGLGGNIGSGNGRGNGRGGNA
jgi:hypothetical protein